MGLGEKDGYLGKAAFHAQVIIVVMTPFAVHTNKYFRQSYVFKRRDHPEIAKDGTFIRFCVSVMKQIKE